MTTAALAPFFNVSVSHGFFGDRPVPELDWVPTAGTRRLLARAGCAFAPTRGGIGVFFDSQRRDLLASCLADARERFRLRFRWAWRGLPLDSISAATPRQTDRVLFFSSRRAVAEPDSGCWRLHREHEAGAADWRPVPARGVRPQPVVSLRLQPADMPVDGAAPKEFRIRFAARATVWKYFFVGNWPAAQVQVVDPAQEAEFTAAVPETLADGRTAVTVRSTTPIALQQRPVQRFRLMRRDDDGNEHVLVASLPAASALASGPISEIYV
jgi:hypothetical protein